MDSNGLANWASSADRWQHRPPIVPAHDDITWFEQAAARCPRGERLRGLLLGVTADIATMAWPAPAAFVAVDWSAAMIASAWPHARLAARRHVIQADWRALPLAAESCDFAAGDGCHTALGSLAAITQLHESLARVLSPGGLLAMRCFSRGDNPPVVDDVFAALLDGRERNLGLVRWLLMMALQGRGEDGVVLDDLWQLWRERVPDPGEPAAAFGWYDTEIANIERYAGQQVRYVYPTVAELQAAAAPAFDLVACDLPSWSHGEHFPRLLFERRVA